MSAAQPPPLLQQQQLQQIQHMQQPLLPHDPGDDDGGGRAGKTFEAPGFFPPHQPQQPRAVDFQAGPLSSSHTQQLQQQSLGPRPDFPPQQQIFYPQPQQQLLQSSLPSGAPSAAGSAGAGTGRTTTGSSSSSVPGRAAAAPATGNPSSSSAGCNQIQVEPRHVLQLLRQLVDGNPESFKRFQVRPDMPPRAVHQLLRELEDARLIKQQEVLRRAHALALQQQQHREGSFESVSPPSSACATPSLGVAPATSAGPAAAQERGHSEGRYNREQQQQGQQLAGDAGESERKKKKRKKAVFPEGPGGWGPETTNSSNAAAAAAATATAAPAASALSNKSTTSSSTDVSRLLKVLPTLPHDKQVDLLVELLAAPGGLARAQELKDIGRLSSALVQQALRKYRQQQKCRTSSSSSGSAGRLNEGGAHQQTCGDSIALLNRAVFAGISAARDGSGIGGSSSHYTAAQLADLGSHAQRRPSFVKSLHHWTRKEDAWAATAAAAAADLGYVPAAAEGLLTAPPEVLAAASQQEGSKVLERPQTRTNGDYARHTAGFAAFAPRCGDLRKAHSSSVWLSGDWSDGAARKTLHTPDVCSGRTNGEVGHMAASYFEADPAEIVFSSSIPIASGATDAASIGMKREQRSESSVANGGPAFDYSEALQATESREGGAAARSTLLMKGMQNLNVDASHSTTAAAREWVWQQQLQQQQHSWVPGTCFRQASEEESEDSARALREMRHCRGRLGASLSSSQVMIHPAVTVAAENEMNGGETVAFRATLLDTFSFVSNPPLRAASRMATNRDRAQHSALLLYNSSINGWGKERGGAGGREEIGGNEEVGNGVGRAPRIDPAAFFYFGKGVDGTTDSKAAIQTMKKASYMCLSRLEAHIQRLVELTVRRLGAAYGGRLFLTGEAEIRGILKQALKDRLRALAPTLWALAEYRAERHLQRLVTAAAETEHQRSTGKEILLGEAEDTERSMMMCGSVGRRSDRTNHLFYDGSSFPGLMEGALLEGETPQQPISATRKRSHADTTWQSSMTSRSDGTDVTAIQDAEADFIAAGAEVGNDWPHQMRGKSSRKSLLQRFAVDQRFDELHVLFMQKESDKLLVEHLRKLQEHQRKGKGGGRGKHKQLLATDSSLQSVPFIRNADDGREGYDSAMGGFKPAVAASGGARDAAAAAAVFAYLEKQALLLNSSSINSDADAQLALLSAQLQLELRQQQLSEVAEEKAVEFAKVAHAQRLLLLKATALDFRTFLHTKTAAAFFPMRFRERLLQYVEAVHFDLQPPPPRIPRTLLPVASPTLSAAEAAAAAPAHSTAVAPKTTTGPAGKAAAEKKPSTATAAGSHSVHLARSGGLPTAVSRSMGSGKSSTTLVSAFAACGLLRSPSAVSDGAKSSAPGPAAKEARRAVPLSIPSQTIMEGQSTAIQLTGERKMESGLSHRDDSAAAGAAGGYIATKDGSNTVGTGKKGGILKTLKARVRRKVSATVVGPGQTNAFLQQRGYGEEQAGAKTLGSAETPEAVSGGGTGMRGKSGGREGATKRGTQNERPADHRGGFSVSSIEGYKHPTANTDALSTQVAPDKATADNRELLRRQQERRISSPPSRTESLAELFGIPTVDANSTTKAGSRRPDDNAGVKPNSSSNLSNGSRQSDDNVRNRSRSATGSRGGAAGAGDVLQTQPLTHRETADTGYAARGSAQWGFQTGHAPAGDALNRKQPQQSVHYQQSTDHLQKSGQVAVLRDESTLTTGSAWTTEQPDGFSSIVGADNLIHGFGTVSATECSSADVVIPELEGEGEEDCL